jgi:hypothetical protein
VNNFAYRLLCLGLLATLTLTLNGAQQAGAQAPQQPTPDHCLETPILGRITGTVSDSDSKPLAGVSVIAYGTMGTAPLVATTSTAGAYALSLPPDTYRLEFRPADGNFQAAWYKSGASPSDATPVEVPSGKTVNGLDVRLPAGASLKVALRDAAGDPVKQALVTVFDRYGRSVAAGVTDDQGQTLTTPGLTDGGYRLFVRPPYGGPLVAQYYNQKPTLAAADVITIAQALANVDVQMTMQRGASLSGSVTDAAGAPLPGIAVTITGTDGDSRFVSSDAQGHYRVAGLPSGTYRVAFGASQPAPGSPAPQRRTVALVAPNDLGGVNAALSAGGAISGRITLPDGTPIADVSVHARDLDGLVDTYTASAADGSYTLSGLPSGRYELSFSAYGYKASTLNGLVTVTAPSTTSAATALLRAGGAITGRVIDLDGAPVAGVYVSVLDAASGKPQDSSGSTNDDGVYTTAPTLASGSYIVKFQPPIDNRGCPLAITYSGNASSAAAATRVEVSAPTTATGVDAKLGYGGFITGQITDAASGAPLSGEVLVYDASGTVVANANVSALGYYRTSSGLPAGGYRLQFKVAGYLPLFYGGATALEAAVTVPSGANNISMGLRRGATITGQITAADTGAPLEHALVTIYGLKDQVVDTRLTGFDGSYRFDGSLPAGQYRIGVTPGRRIDDTPYFSGYEDIFSGGARSLGQARPISAIAAQTVAVNLAMPIAQAAPPTPVLPTPTPPPSPTPDRHVYLPLLRR